MDYQVVRKIAEGAVAEVFLARPPTGDGQVVLKVLRPELTGDAAIVGRFLDESQICQRLDHPNIIKHLGAGRLPDGRVYILTEYLEGEDLGSRIRTQGPLAAEDLVRLVLPLCSALTYVHQRGVVHRDLKPDNVFLKGGLPAFDPRLIDFGLALFQGPKAVKTAAGIIVATPEYTPPECINGQKADARSDLYALGVLMFEALSGSPPFVSGSYSELLLKHLNEPPPALPPDVQFLQPVVNRCLAKNPVDRFPTVDTLAQALKESSQPGRIARTLLHGAQTPTGRAPADAQVVGSYQIIKLLGEGAMGRVYLAKHLKLGRQVALKMLRAEHARNPQLVQRFIQEAQTVNQINHEHIVEIYDFLEDGDPERKRVAFVMELLNGSSLAERQRSEQPSIERIIRIARQVCSALAAAHKVGVVHRDIKPDNIFITERSGVGDFVKVLDFGVAKLVRPLSDSPTVGTMEGVIIGTPAYMAPEQAAGKSADHRTDIYAVGVVLYEALVGHPPFEGEAFGQLVVQIVTQPPPPPPERTATGERIPPALKAVVMKCLAKDPAERWQSMESLGKALADLVASAEPASGRLALKPRRRWGRAVVGTVLLLGLGAAGWQLFPRRPEPAPPVAVAAPLPQPVAPPVPPAVPAEVKLSVTSFPPGAKVVRADTGEALGITPFTRSMPRAEAPLRVRLDLPGHEARERHVVLDRDVELEVELLAKRASPTHRPGPKKSERVTRDGVLDPFAN